MTKCAIFLADGFEETEAIATADVLRRANRLKPETFQVDLVSITHEPVVTGAWGTKVIADTIMADLNFAEYDALILPGGVRGVENLMQCEPLLTELKKHYDAKKTVCAICAAPQILGKLGMVDNKEVTFYPGCDMYLDNAVKRNSAAAIQDGNIITGSSIGGALLFGLQIVDHFTSTETMLELHQTLVFND